MEEGNLCLMLLCLNNSLDGSTRWLTLSIHRETLGVQIYFFMELIAAVKTGHTAGKNGALVTWSLSWVSLQHFHWWKTSASLSRPAWWKWRILYWLSLLAITSCPLVHASSLPGHTNNTVLRRLGRYNSSHSFPCHKDPLSLPGPCPTFMCRSRCCASRGGLRCYRCARTGTPELTTCPAFAKRWIQLHPITI